jgi:hypothetical protein
VSIGGASKERPFGRGCDVTDSSDAKHAVDGGVVPYDSV